MNPQRVEKLERLVAELEGRLERVETRIVNMEDDIAKLEREGAAHATFVETQLSIQRGVNQLTVEALVSASTERRQIDKTLLETEQAVERLISANRPA